MSGAMDLVQLRQLVGGVIATLKGYYTHEKLGEACERLGLPEPPGQDEGRNASASKPVSPRFRMPRCRAWPSGS